MDRADFDRFESGAPPQRVDRVAAGRKQVASAASARANPFPAAVPIGDARKILSARKPDVAQPAISAEPSRELQQRVVSQHERDDRPHAGAPYSVANAHELRDVETRGLFEDE